MNLYVSLDLINSSINFNNFVKFLSNINNLIFSLKVFLLAISSLNNFNFIIGSFISSISSISFELKLVL